MRFTLIHYSYAPVVGGVEAIIARHAALFLKLGHEVTVVCGVGCSDRPGLAVKALPELQAENALVREAAVEIESGRAGPAFATLESRLIARLSPLIAEQEVVFVHNALHMPFHLGLTAALWKLAEQIRGPRFISWIHDLAAANPDYHSPHITRWPWSLLISRSTAFEYVAVSEQRRAQFMDVTGSGSCAVVPNPVDPIESLGLTPPVAGFAEQHGILDRDIILLHPARLLARKNIEFSIEVAAALKAFGVNICCLVTAPPDAQKATSTDYAGSLREGVAQLGLAADVFFLNDLFAVTTADLISLYHLADAVFFPSKQEGFGLPLLEAALHRLPIFCADIEPMKSLINDNVTWFEPRADAAAVAARMLEELNRSAAFRARKDCLRRFSSTAVSRDHLEPLLSKRR